MLAKVIATTVLLVVVVCVIRWKRDRERRRLQEAELAFFLSFEHEGQHEWNNVKRNSAQSVFDSLPVMNSCGSDLQEPERINQMPVEAPGRFHLK